MKRETRAIIRCVPGNIAFITNEIIFYIFYYLRSIDVKILVLVVRGVIKYSGFDTYYIFNNMGELWLE